MDQRIIDTIDNRRTRKEEEKLQKLINLYFQIYGIDNPSDQQLSNLSSDLYLLELDLENASAGDFINKKNEYSTLVNRLSPPEKGLKLSYLKKIKEFGEAINDNGVSRYESIVERILLLGFSPEENIGLQNLRLAQEQREFWLIKNSELYDETDPDIYDFLNNLPQTKLKDLHDLYTYGIILQAAQLKEVLQLDLPDSQELNRAGKLSQLFYNLGYERMRLGLDRNASEDQIYEAFREVDEAIVYIRRNQLEIDENAINMKDVKRLLKEKHSYENLAAELNLPTVATKTEIAIELDKLGVREYIQSEPEQIVGLKSGYTSPSSSNVIQQAREKRETIMEEFQKSVADDITNLPNLTPELLNLSTEEIERRIRIVEKAKKLEVQGQDVLMNMTDQALAQRYRELGLTRRDTAFDRQEKIKKNIERRTKATAEAEKIDPTYDPTGQTLWMLENQKINLETAKAIGTTVLQKDSLEGGATIPQIRQGLKKLGYGRIARTLYKQLDTKQIEGYAKAVEPQNLWANEEQVLKKQTEEKTKLAQTIQLFQQSNPDPNIQEQAYLQTLVTQLNKATEKQQEAQTQLDQTKLRAEPYKAKIEAKPTLKNAVTIQQMFAENIDANSKPGYNRVEKKVKKQIKDNKKGKRKEERIAYKVGPLTRGIFARRRIARVRDLKNRAKELGYQDPEQLQRAGFLKQAVLKREESKGKLVAEATRYGLSPSSTTAHELNVERRIHQLGLHKAPRAARIFRGVFNFGNRTIVSNQAIADIDPVKQRHNQQRVVPYRLARGLGAPVRFVGKIINPKKAKETVNIGKGIFAGVKEVAKQLEKGPPEKK